MKNLFSLRFFSFLVFLFLMACTRDKEMPGVYDSCCGSEPVEFSPQGTTARVYVPNVFTPNADGINDLFYPLSNGGILTINYVVISKQEEGGSTTLLYQVENIDANDPYNYSWDGEDLEGNKYKGGFDYQISFYTTDGLAFAVQGKGCSVDCEGEIPTDNPRQGCFYPAQADDGTVNLNLPTGEYENCF